MLLVTWQAGPVREVHLKRAVTTLQAFVDAAPLITITAEDLQAKQTGDGLEEQCLNQSLTCRRLRVLYSRPCDHHINSKQTMQCSPILSHPNKGMHC